MRRALPLLVAIAAAAPAAPAAAQGIAAADVEPHLRALDEIATAHGGNRAAGTPGAAATVDYIAQRMAEAGWNVTRQPVAFPYFGERTPPVVGTLRPGRDVVTLRYSGAGDVTARVLPMTRSGCSRRHFRRVHRGRILVSFFGSCTFRRTALNAQRAGARAILFVSGSGRRPPTAATMLGPGVRIPALAVRDPLAVRLARRRARLHVRVDAFVEERTADNVVAELPAGEPIVMAGGHLDSVPEGPGINDNGSGIAALIEVAERLAGAPRPAATLRMGFWTAEELNLNGSRAHVRGLPPEERRRFVGYLNLDMVGSPFAVPEIYSDDARMRRALRDALPRAGSESVRVGSDHLPFRRAGIAVGGIYTGATEAKTRRQARRHGGRAAPQRDPCYHRPCDTLANANAETTARMAGAAQAVLTALAR